MEELTTIEKAQGVELIKKTIKALYNITDEVIKDLKDKKINIAEVIGLGDNAFELIMIATKFDQLKIEIFDVDSDEIQELIQFVIDLGFLPDNAVTIISNVVQLIEKEIAVYNENIKPIIDLIKENKAK